MRKAIPGNNLQTPNSKLQRSSKLEARAAVWSLALGISLVFGAWFLVFRFRDFSGAWDLVLGVSLSGGSKTGMRSQPSLSDHWLADETHLHSLQTPEGYALVP